MGSDLMSIFGSILIVDGLFRSSGRTKKGELIIPIVLVGSFFVLFYKGKQDLLYVLLALATMATFALGRWILIRRMRRMVRLS